WFIVFVLIAWSLSYGYFPFYHPGMDRLTYLFMGFISALLLFVCVLLHELSHSYTANRLGLDIHNITLFIFGGVAELTKEPEDAKAELKIAIAGPLSSGALALIFWGLSKAASGAVNPAAVAVLSYLAMINTALMLFNMIPGFPLDGGRVLRAIWWGRTGDLNRATQVSSGIGKGFAVVLILSGFLQILTGNAVGGFWSVLIGIFLRQAAESGYKQLVMKRMLEGIKVRDVMSKDVVAMDGALTVTEAIERYFLTYHFASFPVTSGSVVAGLLTLTAVKNIDKGRWGSTAVRDIMHALDPLDVLSPEESALTALMRMTGDSPGRFPVIENGRLVGIITRSDIMKTLELRSALRK
ncbi:MAG: site-2 protease family protein, partial [Deltaproteobacteria bacterium]|nr:site-2 protease family protein [Deltaproteobacteria bacterium]